MEQKLASTPQDEPSRRRMLGRVISAVILSLAAALIVHAQELMQGAMGKAAFLASDAVRYDKYLAQPHLGTTLTGFIVGCLAFGAYELLALGIYKVIAIRPRG